jgi:putative ABC transport system ATP-binding protein
VEPTIASPADAAVAQRAWRPAAVEPAARAEHVTKVYGSGQTAVRALDDVSVAFARGRFSAIMGPSGSGKSTLMHCVAGLDTVTGGRIWIGDVDLTTLGERQLTRLRRERVGFVFQSYNLLPTLTAAENIQLPLAIAGRKPDRGWLERVIDTVGVRERLTHRPAELSGGQQQRVTAARALVSQPAIVVADEPSGNLDSRSGAELLQFMRRGVDESGQTIVMVTHHPTAASYADQVLFLADGRILDDLARPTAERVLDRMKSLGADDAQGDPQGPAGPQAAPGPGRAGRGPGRGPAGAAGGPHRRAPRARGQVAAGGSMAPP